MDWQEVNLAFDVPVLHPMQWVLIGIILVYITIFVYMYKTKGFLGEPFGPYTDWPPPFMVFIFSPVILLGYVLLYLPIKTFNKMMGY